MKPVAPAVWLSTRGVYAALALALVLAVASVVPALLYAFAGLAVAFVGLVAADVALGPTGGALRVAREPLGYVALRRRGVVRYRIENRAPVAIRLGIVETPVPNVTFERDELDVALPARSQLESELGFLPRERGPAVFSTVYCWVENRIGLVRRRYAVDASETVRVFPDLSAVESYGTLARRNTLLEAGLRRMRLRGAGNEFESLRDYQAGDAFRAIDWKASARRGRLMTAQYEVERSQTVVVVLDCGRLMTPRIGAQRKFDYALTAALSVARIARAADDNVGLFAFAARPLLSIAPRRGAAHVDALARAAYDLQPRLEEPDYEATFTRLARTYAKRSLFVVFTDMFDPVASAAVLAAMRALVPRHLVLCVLMNDEAIARALDRPPATSHDAYRTAVAMTLADERERALAMLRAQGSLIVDVPATQLTVALLDAYLDVKARGLL